MLLLDLVAAKFTLDTSGRYCQLRNGRHECVCGSLTSIDSEGSISLCLWVLFKRRPWIVTGFGKGKRIGFKHKRKIVSEWTMEGGFDARKLHQCGAGQHLCTKRLPALTFPFSLWCAIIKFSLWDCFWRVDKQAKCWPPINVGCFAGSSELVP